jgi:hypothetical protein
MTRRCSSRRLQHVVQSDYVPLVSSSLHQPPIAAKNRVSLQPFDMADILAGTMSTMDAGA